MNGPGEVVAQYDGSGGASGGGASREPLLKVTKLAKQYSVRRGGVLRRHAGALKVVDGISFSVAAGETIGLVGKSGCSKTTAAVAR